VAIKTDISAQKNHEIELWQLANFDHLTQLANRNLFHDRLKQALARAGRESRAIALLYLDLDRFKPVNDQYGHDAGDKVLQQVARRLKRSIRSEDTAARLGGDEFIVLLEGSLQEIELSAIASKIIHALGQPIDIDGQNVEVGCSIGIARYPKDGITNDALINAADTALYQAKAKGRGGYAFAVGLLDDTDPVKTTK
jgi:diguanylate cyclase (GGDEF)-like protein